MWGVIIRALAWAGQAAIGWVGSDWFNERQTTKQQTPEASEKVIAVNAVKKHWIKWAVGAAGLVLGFILLHKIFLKEK